MRGSIRPSNVQPPTTWGPSTIHGHAGRGTGILNNRLYVGELVWNRLRYVKDPSTGRRVSRPNATSAVVVTPVPELRIVSDDVWDIVKRRQENTRQMLKSGTKLVQVRRPAFLLSGLTKCGVCGRNYTMASRNRLACAGAKDLAAVERQIEKWHRWVMEEWNEANDDTAAGVRQQLSTLAARKRDLETRITAAEAARQARPLLHPGMAKLYRDYVIEAREG